LLKLFMGLGFAARDTQLLLQAAVQGVAQALLLKLRCSRAKGNGSLASCVGGV
jgi:hypothetical protein